MVMPTAAAPLSLPFFCLPLIATSFHCSLFVPSSPLRHLPPCTLSSSMLSQATLPQTAQRSSSSSSMDDSPSSIVPAVIVGAGRVGLALANMGSGRDLLVRRGEKVPADSSGPVFVCTRNNDLDAVLEATPRGRWDDLVFFQNGMLEPWLGSKGLLGASQVLVYFAVAKLGEAPIDGKTDVNPEGLTAATGKWASAVAARLKSAGLLCKVLDAMEFQKPLLEKLIWISAFMLVGVRHSGATVGTIEKDYCDEVLKLVRELAAASSAEKGVTFDPGLEERLCAYARSIAHFPTALKEFEWRNGWFYSLSQKAIASGMHDPFPLHTAWLKEVGAI
eukprot:c25472_g1_i2 orf=467-1465(-)